MSDYTFDVTKFRSDYPAFADTTTYPDAVLQQDFNNATCYIANQDYGYLSGDCRYRALTLLTAHLAILADQAAAGKQPGLVQQAQVDRVRVYLTPPPIPTQWQWWLGLTAYGQQLLALLQASAVGGFYVGGLPERAGFRKVGGVFWGF